MGRIVAVVGMPGSGKGVLARIAADGDIPVFAMGDIVREALIQADIEETPTSVGKMALAIRREHGEAIVATRMLPRVQALSAAPLILIEGVRQSAEMDIFHSAFGDDFSILAIRSPAEARGERIAERGRGEDGDAQDFTERDARESDWGLPELIATASITLDNDSDLSTFESRCRVWLGGS